MEYLDFRDIRRDGILGRYDIESIQFLLEQGIDPNKQNIHGETVLMQISGNDNIDLVQLLLDWGANPYLRDSNEDNALMHAIRQGAAGIANLLLQFDDSDNIQKFKIMYTAISSGRDDIVQILLDHGYSPNLQDRNGDSILSFVPHYYPDIFELLFKCGANPNIQNINGETPLHIQFSINATSLDILESLIVHGARVNIRDNNGKTPLMLASIEGYDRVVDLLLRYDANPNIQDMYGDTALMLAVKGPIYQDTFYVVDKLLTGGANPNILNRKGQSALYFAVKHDNPNEELIDMLLDAGADPELPILFM